MDNKLDISFLFSDPQKTKIANLYIIPLTPLSIVKSLPGSFYKTEKVPDKFVLCGLFENIIGLHIDEKMRKDIRKKMEKILKKEYKYKIEKITSNVGYVPVVNNHFEIDNPVVIPNLKFYSDMWTQHVIGEDSRHLDGAVNYSWKLEKDIIHLQERTEKSKYFKENRGKFPEYYRTMQKREFIITEGIYIFKLKINEDFYEKLNNAIKINNNGYLGTSEGWVDLSLEEVQ